MLEENVFLLDLLSVTSPFGFYVQFCFENRSFPSAKELSWTNVCLNGKCEPGLRGEGLFFFFFKLSVGLLSAQVSLTKH